VTDRNRASAKDHIWRRDPIRLVTPARLWRHGSELRLVLQGTYQEDMPARPDSALIRAIARGLGCYEELISGAAPTINAIAAESGLTNPYVARAVL
jgi:hypothetical protein